jgi:hypothetical protein
MTPPTPSPTQRGLICSGTGFAPVGTACPVEGDVAFTNCLPSFSSFKDSVCVAPADAKCISIQNEAWFCVFPLNRDERQLHSKVAKDATSTTSNVGKAPSTKTSKAEPRNSKPLGVKVKSLRNDSEDCSRTTQPPTTETPTTEIPTTETPTTEMPTTQTPTTETPTTETPTNEIPTTETPATEIPITEALTAEPVMVVFVDE